MAGLISALKIYDPTQKKSFGSYAAMRIRGAILDELRRMDWMPRNARTNFKRLRKTVEELEQKLGRPASEDEVRNELKLSPQEYEELMDEVRPISFLPLDHSPAGEDSEDTNLYEVIADESLVSLEDARALIELRACHVFNVRISKCGGLLGAGRIRDLGREAGINTMLGAHVGETAILAAAGRHFAARTQPLRFAEGSYGKILLEADVSDEMDLGPGGTGEAISRNGLGLDVDLERIAAYAVSCAKLTA